VGADYSVCSQQQNDRLDVASLRVRDDGLCCPNERSSRKRIKPERARLNHTRLRGQLVVADQAAEPFPTTEPIEREDFARASFPFR
jgi:hypothetical protein